MLCGAFHFDYPNDLPLLQRLPKLIHIPGAQGRMDQGLGGIVQLIARESASRQPGTDIMLKRLTELLFIQVIRLWIDEQGEGHGGWAGALRDQPVSTALDLIHREPERRWTVKELAAAAALSRSAFSARFTELVGEPPLTYLTRWRMLRRPACSKTRSGWRPSPSSSATSRKPPSAKPSSAKSASPLPSTADSASAGQPISRGPQGYVSYFGRA